MSTRQFLHAVAVASVMLAASCHRTPRQTAPAQPLTVEVPPAQNASPTTTLSAGGCTVNLPGRWSQVRMADDHGYWSTESEDGSQTLDVLPVPQNAKDLHESLDAILDTRRGVDAEQHGPNIVLSEKEFFEKSAWYFLSNTSEGYVMATMTKATPKLACALFLVRHGGNLDEFRGYAKSVLKTVTVDE